MKYTVQDELIRLDVFLSREANISRSNVKNILDNEGALVNGSLKFKSGFELKKGDVVEFNVPEPKHLDLSPENIPLDIVYQDEDIIVINKPKGMVVHPLLLIRRMIHL